MFLSKTKNQKYDNKHLTSSFVTGMTQPDISKHLKGKTWKQLTSSCWVRWGNSRDVEKFGKEINNIKKIVSKQFRLIFAAKKHKYLLQKSDIMWRPGIYFWKTISSSSQDTCDTMKEQLFAYICN
jgi:hypothetical protein